MRFKKIYRRNDPIKKIIKKALKPSINNIKGKIGEAKVDFKLNSNLSEDNEHLQINNLIIVDEAGKSHQIDHVEIRRNGIFCIETKNYKGWIFGEENQEQWTQVLYNERYKFLNPIKQNRSHIYQLNRILQGKYKINSLVVMTQNNADKINIPYVINLKNLNKYLNSYHDGTILFDKDMEAIYNILQNASNRKMTNREHVENVQRTQESINNHICPRCGGSLVLKNGRYGSFYGCQNYPTCKFTKNI